MKYLKLYEHYKNITCPYIPLLPEVIEEINQYETEEDLLRNGGISIDNLDRMAHGFCESDITTLMPGQLKIIWKTDMENVIYEQERSGLTKVEWAKTIDLSEPIDVEYLKGKFRLQDGHHRYYAAKILKKPLNVNLVIEENSILILSPELSYDDFHRCAFRQVKNKYIN